MMEEADKMIDLHTHILPGLDDGAKTLEESIRMCRVSCRDGVRTIVTTPHTLNGIYLNGRETILKKVGELKEALRNFCFTNDLNDPNGLDLDVARINPSTHLRSHPMTQLPDDPITDFQILPGADARLCEDTLSHLDQGKLMTISDGRKYLFLEFPFQGIPYRAEEAIFQVMSRGIIPIITHPERNLEIGQRPHRYYEMIRIGCLGQVTAMSLTGELGSKIKQVAERLLKKRLIHFIASDAHSTDGRPPILSEGVKAAERLIGKEEARKMVTEYPQAILDGRRPNVSEPISP